MWDNMFSDFVTYLEKKPKNLFKKKKQQSPKQQKKREVGYAYVPITTEEAIAEAIAKSIAFEKAEETKKDAGPSKAAVKEELSSDSEGEVKRVPKLKIRKPLIDESSSDDDLVKKPRPRARVKKEESPPVVMTSSSASEIESSSSESSDEYDEEEPIITKQLRSRTVGKESQKPESKMSLRSRNPVVKLTRLEDVTKLSYEVKKMEESTPVVKEEGRNKRNLTPVESTRSSKRRKQEEVKEEFEVKGKKEDKTPTKKSRGEIKVKSEEKTEKVEKSKSKTDDKSATPDAKATDTEDTPSKRSSRQSERTKKLKAIEMDNAKDKKSNEKNKDGKEKDNKDKDKDRKDKVKDKTKEENRAGWEDELVAFKRSLRMPASLIKITTPPGWPKSRTSASLPDLDSRSASPLTCDSFDMEEKKVEEADKEGNHKTSFLNQLAQRYGATKKFKGKKTGDNMERKCKIIPQGSQVQKLLTPQVDEPQGGQSRKTRTELRRDTFRRVFGDDRPASAPPAPLQVNTPQSSAPVDNVSPCKDKEHLKKKKKLEHAKMKKKLSPVSRTGLRSATKLRSNKVLLQRQRIQKKRRSSLSNVNKALNLGQNCPQNKIGQGLVTHDGEAPSLLPCKHNKMKTMRRKFRSSGFDYIRKKKKKKHSKRHLGEDLHKKVRY